MSAASAREEGRKGWWLAAMVLAIACAGDRATPPERVGADSSRTDADRGAVGIAGVPAELTPPDLGRDYYPHGLTHDSLLASAPGARGRSGHVGQDETWSGVVRLTGDLEVDAGFTLNILPGTWVLVAARRDDQAGGQQEQIDPFNPKDPPNPQTERTLLRVRGNLLVQGTQAQPVIFTSDAPQPHNDDWHGLLLVPDPGSRVEITRALVEYGRYVGIGSAEVVIQQCILRNMMGCVVIGGSVCEVLERVPLDLTPRLTQNYIYNTGRNAVTIRSGAPTVTHNVIRARPDLETTGWEQGAIAADVPTCAVIEHNYLDGSAPQPYQGEIFGLYHEYTEPKSAGLAGVCRLTFRYNTLTGSPLALETHAGDWSIEYNNLLPTAAAASDGSWQNSGLRGIVVRHFQPEASDRCQIAFLEQIGGAPTVDTVQATHNYWGTPDQADIDRLCWLDGRVKALAYLPIEAEFIGAALPDWRAFEW